MRATSKIALGGLQDERRKLELPLDGQYEVPGRIELDGESLVWGWNGGEKTITHFDGVLGGFVQLHHGDDAGILNFAQRWGVLHPCPEHPSPSEGERNSLALIPGGWCLLKNPKGHGHVESLAEWRALSRKIDGAIRISYDLALGRPGSADSWDLFNEEGNRNAGRDVTFDRDTLLHRLNRFVYGQVVPQIKWRNESYAIDFRVASLFGAVIAQTILVIAHRGVAVCAGCRELFAPKQLKPGTDAYCPKCGTKAADAAAHRRAYQRKKNATT